MDESTSSRTKLVKASLGLVLSSNQDKEDIHIAGDSSKSTPNHNEAYHRFLAGTDFDWDS